MTADHAPQVAIGGGGVIIAFRKVDDLTIFLSSKVGGVVDIDKLA